MPGPLNDQPHLQATSVIVTTYNQPQALTLCLLALSFQTFEDFEIVIADDGSGKETEAVIQWAKDQLGLRIQHIWHRDDGFRKCRILNKAILSSRGDYLVFTDGDCLPRRDFLATHDQYKTRGHFLSGGYIKLTKEASNAIGKAQIANGDFCRRSWLRSHGYPFKKSFLKLTSDGVFAKILNRFTTTRAGWHGHNSSCWKSDALLINGFDERMGWGGEDREFGYRLVNLGLIATRVRYSAICTHLFHERPWRNLEILAQNDQMRNETKRTGTNVTQHGISQLPAD